MNSLHLPQSINIKNSFLFPSPGKLLLASALFLFWGWVVWPAIVHATITDWYPVGFPFEIRVVGLCLPSYVCKEFSWPSLIGDIVSWYVVSSVVIHTRTPAWRLLIYLLVGLLATKVIAVLWFVPLDLLLRDLHL